MDTTDQHGSNSVNVGRVFPESLPFMWEPVKALLEKHPQHFLDYTSAETVYEYLMENRLELWIGLHQRDIELACITHLFGHKKKYLEILWIGGKNFERYAEEGLKKLEVWAAIAGASELRVGGRKGLLRLLASRGFKQQRVELAKTISYVKIADDEVARLN